jgi:ATP-dependent Clp protease ATP-binding subunit ClpA
VERLVVFSPPIKRLLAQAKAEAVARNHSQVDIGHLALVLLSDEHLVQLLSDEPDIEGLIVVLRQRIYDGLIEEFWKARGSSKPTPAVYLNLPFLDDQFAPSQESLKISFSDRSLENRLSSRSETILGAAVWAARKFGHSQITVECLMLGLLHETFGATFNTFSLFGVRYFDAETIFQSACVRVSDRSAAARDLSFNARLILLKSEAIAQEWAAESIEPEHILLAIAAECKGSAAFACEALQIDGQELEADLVAEMIKLSVNQFDR